MSNEPTIEAQSTRMPVLLLRIDDRNGHCVDFNSDGTLYQLDDAFDLDGAGEHLAGLFWDEGGAIKSMSLRGDDFTVKVTRAGKLTIDGEISDEAAGFWKKVVPKIKAATDKGE